MSDRLDVLGRWRIEPSREGIPLVFGDGKYPHDPPRIASELESALAEQLAGAAEALKLIARPGATYGLSDKLCRSIAQAALDELGGQS